MTRKEIRMGDNHQYLSEIGMVDIPDGILMKGSTGCGGTTIALTNDVNYIIAVPMINLIVNKCSQFEHGKVLPVMGNGRNTPEYINAYLDNKNFPVKKIMVTYNSLPQLLETIGADKLDSFSILIDEFHNIVNEYDFKGSAIYSMINAIRPYINKCKFISATPIPEEFIPSFMKDIQVTNVIWTKTRTVQVDDVYCKEPLRKVVSIINDYLNGRQPMIKNDDGDIVSSREAFFFVNCVNDIVTILKESGLTSSDVRIVCGDNDKNVERLKKYGISKVYDKNTQLKEIENGKRFTFITKTGFEGVDFFSSTGSTYIVSDIAKRCTLVDISSEMKQIAGRIRDDHEGYGVNPFKWRITHIHNSGIIEGGKEHFQNEFAKSKLHALHHISTFQSNPEVVGEDIYNYSEGIFATKNGYYCARMVDGKPIYDELKELSVRLRFERIYDAYKDGFSVSAAHSAEGRFVNQIHADVLLLNCPSIEPQPKKVVRLENRYNQYVDLLRDYSDTWSIRDFERDPDNKILVAAYHLLTKDEMAKCKWKESLIKKAVVAKKASLTVLMTDSYKVFQVGERYSNADIKDRLQMLYKKYLIPGTPKAKDLELYFNLKVCDMQDRSKGFEILSKRTETQKQAEKLRLIMEQLGAEPTPAPKAKPAKKEPVKATVIKPEVVVPTEVKEPVTEPVIEPKEVVSTPVIEPEVIEPEVIEPTPVIAPNTSGYTHRISGSNRYGQRFTSRVTIKDGMMMTEFGDVVKEGTTALLLGGSDFIMDIVVRRI